MRDARIPSKKVHQSVCKQVCKRGCGQCRRDVPGLAQKSVRLSGASVSHGDPLSHSPFTDLSVLLVGLQVIDRPSCNFRTCKTHPLQVIRPITSQFGRNCSWGGWGVNEWNERERSRESKKASRKKNNEQREKEKDKEKENK